MRSSLERSLERKRKVTKAELRVAYEDVVIKPRKVTKAEPRWALLAEDACSCPKERAPYIDQIGHVYDCPKWEPQKECHCEGEWCGFGCPNNA